MRMGERIRMYRDRKKLTQAALGMAVGIDKMTIWRVENGADIKTQVLIRIARVLDVRPEMLLGIDEDDVGSERTPTGAIPVSA